MEGASEREWETLDTRQGGGGGDETLNTQTDELDNRLTERHSN